MDQCLFVHLLVFVKNKSTEYCVIFICHCFVDKTDECVTMHRQWPMEVSFSFRCINIGSHIFVHINSSTLNFTEIQIHEQIHSHDALWIEYYESDLNFLVVMCWHCVHLYIFLVFFHSSPLHRHCCNAIVLLQSFVSVSFVWCMNGFCLIFFKVFMIVLLLCSILIGRLNVSLCACVCVWIYICLNVFVNVTMSIVSLWHSSNMQEKKEEKKTSKE